MILRTWLRHPDGAMLGALNKGLTTTCQGGIYGHLRAGFARYSTYAQWLAPHVEKMLYDIDAANFYARSIWGSDHQHRK